MSSIYVWRKIQTFDTTKKAFIAEAKDEVRTQIRQFMFCGYVCARLDSSVRSYGK
jgi:hypothetical protein